MRSRRTVVVLLLLAGSGLVLAACDGGEQAAPPPAPETATQPAPTETAAVETAPPETARAETAVTEESAEGGRQVYLEAGCAGCHGENAEGTEIGPALPGHSEEQVLRQVRSPLGSMPAYPETQLSDEQLHMIAEYVAGLASAGAPVEPVKLPGLVAAHHWMAIAAIKADNVEDTLFHLAEIAGRVTGAHREAIEEAERLVREGDLHEAEHIVEEMLAGRAEPELPLAKLHLRVALSYLEGGDVENAHHHMEHFLELAQGAEAEKGSAALAALEEGDLHEAEDAIRALLGLGHE
jgi:cytochrome c551